MGGWQAGWLGVCHVRVCLVTIASKRLQTDTVIFAIRNATNKPFEWYHFSDLERPLIFQGNTSIRR